MNSKELFKRHLSTPLSNEFPIITLIPCDESSDDENSSNLSQDSIDSSELVDSSDDETKTIQIKKITRGNQELVKINTC